MNNLTNDDGYWYKPFIQIALRGIRKAHFDFEMWDTVQIIDNLNHHTFDSLNSGWGIFKAPEEHTCAYITQEFAASPFVKGTWSPDGVKRWYFIEREVELQLENVYRSKNYAEWATKENKEENKTLSDKKPKCDMLLSRILYSDENKCYHDVIEKPVVLIEAKRIEILKSKIESFDTLESNVEGVINDIKKLAGIHLMNKKKKLIIDNPVNRDRREKYLKDEKQKEKENNFHPWLLTWGIDSKINDFITTNLKDGVVTVNFDGKDLPIKNFRGISETYPMYFRDKNNPDNKKTHNLKLLLFTFDPPKL